MADECYTSAISLPHVLCHQGKQRKGLHVSLSRLAEHVLGKPLDKASRMSDWNARPLSVAQQRYAALDAWSLVTVYDALAKRDGGLAQLKARVRSHRAVDKRCGVCGCGEIVLHSLCSGRALPQCRNGGGWIHARGASPWRASWRPGVFVRALRLAAL